jgi:hypothetical protein
MKFKKAKRKVQDSSDEASSEGSGEEKDYVSVNGSEDF